MAVNTGKKSNFLVQHIELTWQLYVRELSVQNPVSKTAFFGSVKYDQNYYKINNNNKLCVVLVQVIDRSKHILYYLIKIIYSKNIIIPT